MNLKLDKIIAHPKVMEMCKIPYEGYPDGCPMYNTRSKCPPQQNKMYYEIIDPPYFLIIQEYDLEAQMERMKKLHGNWSDKRCANSRYWQKGFDTSIENEAIEFVKTNMRDGIILIRPEAYGVNLFATCAHNGIILKRKYPLKIVKKMVMVGRVKNSARGFFK